MSGQGNAGFAYTRVNQGAGSTIISAYPRVLHSVATFGTLGGTTLIHDSATVAGTTAANQLFTLNQVAGVGTTPNAPVLDMRFKNGIVAITSGTVDFIALMD